MTSPIRGNYCTLDADGKISDRRAGRIPSDESAPLAVKLRNVKIPGVEVFVEPVKEHRFVVVFRGQGLGGHVHDTDPQTDGRAAAGAKGHGRGKPEDGRSGDASSSNRPASCWPISRKPTG